MDVFLVILKSAGLSLVITAVTLVMSLVVMLLWVRMATRDRAYCLFLSDSKQLVGKLLKPVSNTVVFGKGDDAPKFLIHPSKQFWSYWPPGMPRLIQEPVPSLLYTRDSPEPLDPYNRKSIISPESLRKISDESMLKQTWKDVRESMGAKATLGANRLLLILVSMALVASGAAAYLAFATSGQLNQILDMLGG